MAYKSNDKEESKKHEKGESKDIETKENKGGYVDSADMKKKAERNLRKKA
jgi:hypothetical protein